MPITVHIHSNNGFVIEVPDGTEEPLVGNNSRLSTEEFKAILDRLAATAVKFDGPDAQPLSDYAMSRESIYEGHPKL